MHNVDGQSEINRGYDIFGLSARLRPLIRAGCAS
jgi:hypothetical protein